MTQGCRRRSARSRRPVALTDPAYITLCLLAGFVGYKIAYAEGPLFREGLFQFMTSFSLPSYAVVGAEAAVMAGLPVIGALLIAVLGAHGSGLDRLLGAGLTPGLARGSRS